MVNVNRKSPTFEERPEFLGQRNTFNMSHDHKTTFTMGELIPFFTQPTLPGDTWYLRAEFMFRFAPLYLPIMHRVNFTAFWVYVPNRIMWPGRTNSWEEWINPNSNPLGEIGYEAPYIDVAYGGVTNFNLVIEYMGFPSNLEVPVAETLLVNAFPLSAYLMAWDEFIRNDQIQPPKWFELQAGDNTSEFDNAFGSAVHIPLRVNWNRDNFTSDTPTPQVGNDVLVPMISANPFWETVDPTFVESYPSRWRDLTNDAVTSGNISQSGSGLTLATTTEVGLDIQETAATIRQLRYNEELTLFLERSLRAGDKYPDMLRAMWKSHPTPGTIDRPVFIGSTGGKVVVSEVLSTADTRPAEGSEGALLGSYAGQAMVLDQRKKPLEYHCTEHGIVMGLLYVIPQSSYFQGLTSWWEQWVSPQQYPWEQFALIGDEAVLNKQVAYNFTDSQFSDVNNATFGYRPRYSDYRHANDVYSGLMRSTFISFHLGRLFDQTDIDNLALNESFIQCNPDVTRVFETATGEDEIYAHIYNDCLVKRRLPKYGIPVK